MKGTGHGSPSCGRGDTPGGPPRPERHPRRTRPDARPPLARRAVLLPARARGVLRRRRLHGARLRPRLRSPRAGLRAGGVTVDHGLQAGSELRAAEVASRLRELGLDPVESVAVTVGRDGGPEAAARDARYAALDTAAERHRAAAVLLGHTRDDQAETVLLGLARGSGIRSLSGMAAVSGPTAVTGAPSSSSTGRPPARPAWSSPCPSGTTRTTPTPPTPLPAAPRGPARPGEGPRQGRRRGPRPYGPALP